MFIQTKKDAAEFLKNYATHFIIRKKDNATYFPIAYRGFFGIYAMIYLNQEIGEWKVNSAARQTITKDIDEVVKVVWKFKDEINYTLSKPSICTCPACEESRWYAVNLSYRGNLKRALCSTCLHSFELEKAVEDEYYSLPSM